MCHGLYDPLGVMHDFVKNIIRNKQKINLKKIIIIKQTKKRQFNNLTKT